jgi:hypothetical protein
MTTTTVRQRIALAVLGVSTVVLACGIGIVAGSEQPAPPAAQPTASVTPSGVPFLPVLLNQLASPAPATPMCDPKVWQQLLMPCDLP